jgi:hypothetical protein
VKQRESVQPPLLLAVPATLPTRPLPLSRLVEVIMISTLRAGQEHSRHSWDRAVRDSGISSQEH